MPAQGATPPRAPRSNNKTRANKAQAGKAAEKPQKPTRKTTKAKKTSQLLGSANEASSAQPDQTGPEPAPKPKRPKAAKVKTPAPAAAAPRKTRHRRTRSELLPHEVLLAVARGEVIADHVPTFEERVEAAKAAAPYFAPKGAASTKPVKTLAHEEALAALDQAEPASPQLVPIQDGEGNDRQKT